MCAFVYLFSNEMKKIKANGENVDVDDYDIIVIRIIVIAIMVMMMISIIMVNNSIYVCACIGPICTMFKCVRV